jgi:hypothetical protein
MKSFLITAPPGRQYQTSNIKVLKIHMTAQVGRFTVQRFTVVRFTLEWFNLEL